MGCRYACICGESCLYCSPIPEEYIGHAEDIAAQSRGFRSYEEEVKYNKIMEEEYNKAMEEEYKKQ